MTALDIITYSILGLTCLLLAASLIVSAAIEKADRQAEEME